MQTVGPPCRKQACLRRESPTVCYAVDAQVAETETLGAVRAHGDFVIAPRDMVFSHGHELPVVRAACDLAVGARVSDAKDRLRAGGIVSAVVHPDVGVHRSRVHRGDDIRDDLARPFWVLVKGIANRGDFLLDEEGVSIEEAGLYE